LERRTKIAIKISGYEKNFIDNLFCTKLVLMKFKLKKIPVNIFLGVPDEERKEKQEILVNLSFKFDSKKAEKSDNIENTVDYFEIYNFIKNFPQDREFKLLEYLHQELETSIRKEFPKIKKLKIKIQKFPFSSGSILISK